MAQESPRRRMPRHEIPCVMQQEEEHIVESSQTQVWILRATNFTAPLPSDINYTMSCQLDFLWHSSVTNPLMTASLTALESNQRGQSRGRGSS